jgi:hypothetical protein
MRRVVARAALAAALCGPPAALAAPKQDVAAARTLSRAGAQAFRAADYETAIAKFQAANRLVPHPNLDVNIGRSYEKLGQPEQALVHCKIALNAPGVPAGTRKAARACVDRVALALARPLLEIRTQPAGAAVRVDGRLVGETPWRGGVDPGRRQLDLELAGYAPLSRAVNAERGKTYSVEETLLAAQLGGLLTVSSVPTGAAVTLDGELLGTTPIQGFQLDARAYVLEVALAGHAPQISTITVEDGKHLERTVTMVPAGEGRGRSSVPRWPGWAVAGLGVAAVGAGGYFGISALDDRQAADELARTSNAPEDRRGYDRLISDMEGNRTTADVLMVTGTTALIGGLVWAFWPQD